MVAALRRRLARFGYVVGGRGCFDARTARAVLAFRKVTGMRRTTRPRPPSSERSRLTRAPSEFVVPIRTSHRGGARAQGDRADQGRPGAAHLSGLVGASSTPTVLGTFRFYRKTPGTNAKGMVHSAYFIRGYATHGFASVPIYPASHGCLRVPNADARSLYDWIRIGTPIDVYYGSPEVAPTAGCSRRSCRHRGGPRRQISNSAGLGGLRTGTSQRATSVHQVELQIVHERAQLKTDREVIRCSPRVRAGQTSAFGRRNVARRVSRSADSSLEAWKHEGVVVALGARCRSWLPSTSSRNAARSTSTSTVFLACPAPRPGRVW